MGLYLVIIGVADHVYLGSYLWEDVSWKKSAMCKTAGFLSIFSCEMSALIISIITVDRFIVLRFPFSHLRFKGRSAHVSCLFLWTTGLVLATVPLLPATVHWSFYSQNGICIPLPVTRQYFPGRDYAFGVMIIFNFTLFVFIALGQIAIYTAIRSQVMSKNNTINRYRDLIVARRLLTVVFSDFICWFPIGLLGLLASKDVDIPREVNVGVAIFVLPFNSTLNPFLYTYNIVQERRSRSREQNLFKMVEKETEQLLANNYNTKQ